MSRTHGDARSFVARGADVLSVPEFVRGFVGQAVTAQLQAHPGNLSKLCISYTVSNWAPIYKKSFRRISKFCVSFPKSV